MGNIKGLKKAIFVFKQNEKNISDKQRSIDEIMKAVSYMSEKHTGALIVFLEKLFIS